MSGGGGYMAALKIAPERGSRDSQLRWRGRVVGTVRKTSSGGVLYLPGWQPDLFDPMPPFADFDRLPTPFRRWSYHRSETALVRHLEARLSRRPA